MYPPLLVVPLSSRKTSLSPVVGELWRTRLAVVSGGVGREKTTTAATLWLRRLLRTARL